MSGFVGTLQIAFRGEKQFVTFVTEQKTAHSIHDIPTIVKFSVV